MEANIYSKDHRAGPTLADFARGLQKLVEQKASSEVLCDYIDGKLLVGAWGFLTEKIESPFPDGPFYGHGKGFLRDIRGALIACCGKQEEEADAC